MTSLIKWNLRTSVLSETRCKTSARQMRFGPIAVTVRMAYYPRQKKLGQIWPNTRRRDKWQYPGNPHGTKIFRWEYLVIGPLARPCKRARVTRRPAYKGLAAVSKLTTFECGVLSHDWLSFISLVCLASFIGTNFVRGAIARVSTSTADFSFFNKRGWYFNQENHRF